MNYGKEKTGTLKGDYDLDLFMRLTKTKIKVSFLKHDFHFQDDKEKRDIFEITLSSKGRSFTFNFGQSMAQSNNYGTNKPTEYDILACLQKYDIGTFKDFCSEFGYDIDSRKAEKVYHAVIKEYKNLERIYTEDDLERMRKIQ